MKNKIIAIVIASILLLSSVEMVMAVVEPQTTTQGTMKICNPPTIGITAASVDFGNLYPDSSVTKPLTTTITETPDTDCGLKDMAVIVTTTPGAWKNAVGTPIEGITTIATPASIVVNVGVDSNPNTGVFDLTTTVAPDVPPGIYTTVITITAVS